MTWKHVKARLATSMRVCRFNALQTSLPRCSHATCPVPGSGAGAAIARRFASENYKVALVSRRMETLLPVEDEIKAAGGSAMSFPADTGMHHVIIITALHVSSDARCTSLKPRHTCDEFPAPSLLQAHPDVVSGHALGLKLNPRASFQMPSVLQARRRTS